MSDELARITIRADTQGVVETSRALQELAKQTGSVETAAKQMGAAQRAAAADNAKEMTAVARLTEQLQKKIVAQQEVVTKTGILSARFGDEQQKLVALRAELAASEARHVSLAQAMNKNDAAAISLAKATQVAREEQAKFSTQLGNLGSSIGSTDGIIGRLTRSISALALVYGAIRVGKDVLDMADAYQQVANRVQLFSSSAANAAQVQARLVAIAVETRTPLETIARMYQKISASSQELGVSQSQILTVTKAIGQTFILSGATTQQAAMSANEFARAISEGNLNSRELKVLLGDNVALAQAIAAGMGLTLGQMREMIKTGDVSGRRMFDALLNQASAIASKTETLAPTMSSGFTVLKTGLEAAIGRVDTMLGLTRAIGAAFESIGKTLANPVFAQVFAAGMAGINLVSKVARGDFVGVAQQAGKDVQRFRGGNNQTADLPADYVFQGLTTGPLGAFGTPGAALGALLGRGSASKYRTFGADDNGSDIAVFNALTAEQKAQAREAARAAKDANGKTADARQRIIDALNDEADGIREMNRAKGRRGNMRQGFLLDQLRQSGQLQGEIGGDTSFSTAITDKRIADAKRLVDVQQAAAKQAEQIAQAVITNVQAVFAKGLEAVFTKGIKGISDFGAAIRDTILRAFEQILASAITKQFLKLFQPSGGDGTPSVASGGGILGSIGSIIGMKGPGGFQTGSDPFAIPGRAAQALGPGLAVAGLGFGIGNILGQSIGGTTGVAAGALAGAATGALIGSVVPVLGTAIGGIIGGAAGLIGGLMGAAAKRKAAEDLAKQVVAFSDQLTVRGLVAAGQTFEAQKLELQLKQRAEMDAAVKQFGKNAAVIQQLAAVQARETQALVTGGDPSALGAGTYLAPAGYSANQNRFLAGNPYQTPANGGMPPRTFTGPITIMVPAGTTADQARAMLQQFDQLNRAQGNAFGSMPRIN